MREALISIDEVYDDCWINPDRRNLTSKVYSDLRGQWYYSIDFVKVRGGPFDIRSLAQKAADEHIRTLSHQVQPRVWVDELWSITRIDKNDY